jgi:hypothetical protein
LPTGTRRRAKYLIQKSNDYVDGLVARIGATEYFRKRQVNGSTQWVWSNAKLSWRLREQFGTTSRKKCLPQWLKDATPSELKAFLRGFTEGDGWKCKTGLVGLYTASGQLADDLQEIALKAGFIANVSSAPQKSGFAVGSTLYRVALWSQRSGWDQRDEHSYPHLKTGRGWYKQPYSGKVYCVAVPSGIVLVRRHGKPLWLGGFCH